MPTPLTVEDCAELGLQFAGKRMDNGEYRFVCRDEGAAAGWSYVLTKMPAGHRGWQNSHYHHQLLETYIVQTGWMACAGLSPAGELEIHVYHETEVFTTRPRLAHNVYLPAGAVIHTVKHGDCSPAHDWHASRELDAITGPLSEAEILQLGAAKYAAATAA